MPDHAFDYDDEDLEFLLDDNDEDFHARLFNHSQLLTKYVTFSSNGHGGSHPGRSANINRGSQSGHDRIIKDYFADTPVYGEKLF